MTFRNETASGVDKKHLGHASRVRVSRVHTSYAHRVLTKQTCLSSDCCERCEFPRPKLLRLQTGLLHPVRKKKYHRKAFAVKQFSLYEYNLRAKQSSVSGRVDLKSNKSGGQPYHCLVQIDSVQWKFSGVVQVLQFCVLWCHSPARSQIT